MVHFTFFKLNVSGSHATTRSFHETEEYSDPDCSFWKRKARFDRKMVEPKCLTKEKEGGIAFKQGSYNFSCKKAGPKKQSPRVLEFLIKDIIA